MFDFRIITKLIEGIVSSANSIISTFDKIAETLPEEEKNGLKAELVDVLKKAALASAKAAIEKNIK